jgi:hypothetical protein
MTAAQINSCAWIMRLHASQVIDGTTFYDSISFNYLWARRDPSRAHPASTWWATMRKAEN